MNNKLSQAQKLARFPNAGKPNTGAGSKCELPLNSNGRVINSAPKNAVLNGGVK